MGPVEIRKAYTPRFMPQFTFDTDGAWLLFVASNGISPVRSSALLIVRQDSPEDKLYEFHSLADLHEVFSERTDFVFKLEALLESPTFSDVYLYMSDKEHLLHAVELVLKHGNYAYSDILSRHYDYARYELSL